jgi:hypothetical protein
LDAATARIAGRARGKRRSHVIANALPALWKTSTLDGVVPRRAEAVRPDLERAQFEKIHRRRGDVGEQNRTIPPHPERFEIP